MTNKRVAATIVLVAQLPGRIELAREITGVFNAGDPEAHYVFEAVDPDRPLPILEEDWPVRIVRTVSISSTVKATLSRMVEVAAPVSGERRDAD